MQKRDVANDIFKKYNPSGTFYQAYKLDNGNWTPNYTIGFAILFLPFFFIGHLAALIIGAPADGWSLPYQFAVSNGVMLYIVCGIFVLRKFLLHFFEDRLTTLILVLIILGTNYFAESFNSNLQPHAMLFTGQALLLYYTYRWHEHPQKKYVIIAGLVMGIMILSRPSEIVILIIPLLWGIYNRESFKQKVKLISVHRKHILILVFCAFIPFIPQIIYWKIVTSKFIFYSYQRTEGFDFLSPHIMQVLFSFRNSLIIYTPMFLFFIIGMFFLRKHLLKASLCIPFFFVLNFYLLSSWAAWWNGGGFGMRYFVQSFAVMSLPLGFFLQDLIKRNIVLKIFIFSIMSFFVFLNLFQTWQVVNWKLPEGRLNWKYYKAAFLNTNISENDTKLLDVDRSKGETDVFQNLQDYTKSTIAFNNFENINTISFDENKIDSTHSLSKPTSYLMGADDVWGPQYKIRYDHLVPKNKDHAWLRITVNYFNEEAIEINPASLVVTMPHEDYQLKYHAFDFEKFPSKRGEWNTLRFDYITPFPYSEKDYFAIYLWHKGKKKIWFDDLIIDSYLRKK